MVKKKIALVVALGALMAMSHVTSPYSVGGLEESATDYASNKGVKLHTLRAVSEGYEYSDKMYVQYGVNSAGNDVLRFSAAIKKGNIESITFDRGAIKEADNVIKEAEKKEVTTVYKTIYDGDKKAYYDGSDIVYEQTEATNEWYWACYTIAFTSDTFKDTEISMMLSINGSSVLSRNASLNGVKNPIRSYTLNKDSVSALGGAVGDINFNENNGKSLGNLNGNIGATLTWFVKSNKNETAKMTLNLALSDLANYGKEVYRAGEDFDVSVNGEVISSTEGFKFTEGDTPWVTYRDYEMLSEVSLKEGYNTIVLKVNGAFGNLDHITLDTKAELEVKNSKVVDLKAVDALKANGTGNMALEKNGDAVVGVGYLDSNDGASFTWKVNAKEATPVFFAMNLAVGDGGDIKFSLNVNGQTYENPNLGTLRNTSEWVTYNTYRLPMVGELVKGENTITLTVGSSFGNLGYLKLISAEEVTEISPYASYRLEAEESKINNAKLYDINGTKGIDNLGAWASATWTITVEDVAFVNKIVMGIAIDNDNKGSKADFYININGDVKDGGFDIIHAPHGSNQSIDVIGDDWYVTKGYEVNVAGLLKKGKNTITFTVDSNDGYTSFGNLDYIDFVVDRPMTVAAN